MLLMNCRSAKKKNCARTNPVLPIPQVNVAGLVLCVGVLGASKQLSTETYECAVGGPACPGE